jgi:hypothetical protein
LIARLALPAIVLVALSLLPWTIWLTLTLPSRHVAEHWDAAWAGFDAAEILALAATAWGMLRRSSWLQAAAAIAGALLLADAWFDVLLSAPGRRFWIAVVEAAAAEVPLALLCFAVAADVARFWVQWEHMIELAPPRVRDRLSHLAAPGEGTAERDLVGVFEVTADGEPAGETRDPDAAA